MTHNTRELEEIERVFLKGKHEGLSWEVAKPIVHHQLQKAREEERERIQFYLYEMSHAAYDDYGDEYERYVHWHWVKKVTSPELDQDKKS